MAVPAPEETRQPTIRNRCSQQQVCTISAFYGHVFIGSHEDSGHKATCAETTMAGRWSGLLASGDLENSRGAEKGASQARFVNTLRFMPKLVKPSSPAGATAGLERATSHRPFAARFLPAFFSPASFSTSPGWQLSARHICSRVGKLM